MRSGMEKGFTLVELLAGLAIIGIILSISVFSVNFIMQDAGAQDSLSNAKALEDSVHMYYRDEGVLPTSEEAVSELDERSQEIIRSEVLKAGIPESEAIVKTLIEEGLVKRMDFNKLKDYTKIREDDVGVSSFVVIEEADEETLKKLGAYRNDISGLVFAERSIENSSGVFYSGAHRLEEDVDLNGMEEEIKTDMITDASELTPYGFQLVKSTQGNGMEVSAELVWTGQFVDGDGNLRRGYQAGNYELTCSDCVESSKTLAGEVTEYTFMKAKQEEVTFTLQAKGITFAGEGLSGVSKKAEVTKDLLEELTAPDEDGSAEVNEDVDEITKGTQEEDKNELYKSLQEKDSFSTEDVRAEKEGFVVSGLNDGDRIVVKEVRKDGSEYVRDKNRVYLFLAKAGEVLIPKDPYIQKDFQNNPDSSYEYVFEVYENKPCDCVDVKVPENAVMVYYE